MLELRGLCLKTRNPFGTRISLVHLAGAELKLADLPYRSRIEILSYIVWTDRREIRVATEHLTYPAELPDGFVCNGIYGACQIQTSNEIAHWEFQISRG